MATSTMVCLQTAMQAGHARIGRNLKSWSSETYHQQHPALLEKRCRTEESILSSGPRVRTLLQHLAKVSSACAHFQPVPASTAPQPPQQAGLKPGLGAVQALLGGLGACGSPLRIHLHGSRAL